MDNRSLYGPRDPSLLYLQENHISEDVLVGKIDRIFRARRADGGLSKLFSEKDMHPHHSVLRLLHHMGFYGVYRCGRQTLDWHLITALIERWRQETHTFHFTIGEVTITLQDVALLWGLPVDGMPVTGIDFTYTQEQWTEYCENLLGFRPTQTQFRRGKLQVSAITSHLRHNPVDDKSSRIHLEQYTRGLAFLLLGGLMCPDTTGSTISMMYLKHLENLDNVASYSWGAATLSYLYRELCNASQQGKTNIGGALQLLQTWAWSRIRSVAPIPTDEGPNMTELHFPEDVLPIPPYGARWIRQMSYIQSSRHTVRIFRIMLDQLLPHQFIWQPYDAEDPEYIALAMDPHIICPAVWVSMCPLIFFERVEMHRPNRVIRQFGLIQNIPDALIETNQDKLLHKSDRRGRSDTDWSVYYQSYIEQWNNRFYNIIRAPPISSIRQSTMEGYNDWYETHTRRFISPIGELQQSGMQVGDSIIMNLVADQLRSMEISISTLPVEDTESYALLHNYLPVIVNARIMLSSRLCPIQDPHVLHTQDGANMRNNRSRSRSQRYVGSSQNNRQSR